MIMNIKFFSCDDPRIYIKKKTRFSLCLSHYTREHLLIYSRTVGIRILSVLVQYISRSSWSSFCDFIFVTGVPENVTQVTKGVQNGEILCDEFYELPLINYNYLLNTNNK